MLTIGSRGSKLALWQANHVKALIEALGEPCAIEAIKTTGDAVQHVALKEIGSKGLFTKEIEDALLAGSIDIAVHSLKDMPAAGPGGLVIAATPEREDPRDAMVGRTLAGLPAGGRVGTGSLRRLAQIVSLRPDVRVLPIRGNVDTRLRKLDEGEFDAILLASAGLRRLGWESRIAEYLEPAVMCPAVGQGALAIQTRADGGRAYTLCARLDHAATRAAVTAERAALEQLGGGCQVPVGIHGVTAGDRLQIRAIVLSPDGARKVEGAAQGRVEEAAHIGESLGRDLLSRGAADILQLVYGPAA